MRHYLDCNATAPMRPEVVRTMAELLPLGLNPSSAHAEGRHARRILENSRGMIAEAVGAFPSEIVFTASGSESNNWVLGAFAQGPAVVSAIEHSSVLGPAKNNRQTRLAPATSEGVILPAAVESHLPDTPGFLVSVMLANNETGVIQPVKEIASLVHARGGLTHCDAAQAFGKIAIDFSDLGCDFLTIAGHKMGGPVGAAALVIKNGISLPPLLTGGGQEGRRRAGTENVATVAGFAKATELMDLGEIERIRSWLKPLEKKMEEKNAAVFGRGAARLPNTCCVAMPNASSETQLMAFDLGGIAVSAGSACSSGRIEASHVLLAMGVEKRLAEQAIRISGGWMTTKEDIEALAAQWNKLFQAKNPPL